MTLDSRNGIAIPVMLLYILFVILCFVSAFFLTFNFADFSISLTDYVLLSLSFLMFIPFTAIVALPFWKGRKFFHKMKEADEEELQREDDIYIKAVTFSQSTLFIYLNLISMTSTLQFYLKWLIITTAVLFFVMRGYAKIKCSPKYRFWSTILGIFIPLLNSYYFIPRFLPHIEISGFPIILALWLIMSFIFSLFVVVTVSDGFKTRYGYNN